MKTLFVAILLMSVSAFADDQVQPLPVIEVPVTNVHVEVFNTCLGEACFVANISVNGQSQAICEASVGRGKYPTPKVIDAPFYDLHETYSSKFGITKYTMIFSNSRFFFYGREHRSPFTGRGGIQLNMDCAKTVFEWADKAIKNGGTATISTHDTYDQF